MYNMFEKLKFTFYSLPVTKKRYYIYLKRDFLIFIK